MTSTRNESCDALDAALSLSCSSEAMSIVQYSTIRALVVSHYYSRLRSRVIDKTFGRSTDVRRLSEVRSYLLRSSVIINKQCVR